MIAEPMKNRDEFPGPLMLKQQLLTITSVEVQGTSPNMSVRQEAKSKRNSRKENS